MGGELRAAEAPELPWLQRAVAGSEAPADVDPTAPAVGYGPGVAGERGEGR